MNRSTEAPDRYGLMSCPRHSRDRGLGQGRRFAHALGLHPDPTKIQENILFPSPRRRTNGSIIYLIDRKTRLYKKYLFAKAKIYLIILSEIYSILINRSWNYVSFCLYIRLTSAVTPRAGAIISLIGRRP
jgi:hypothetical protein